MLNENQPDEPEIWQIPPFKHGLFEHALITC
jgi:hypothetical protein